MSRTDFLQRFFASAFETGGPDVLLVRAPLFVGQMSQFERDNDAVKDHG